jgi:hypothetical protein
MEESAVFFQSYTTVSFDAAGEYILMLKPVKRSMEILHNFFHKPETVRVWLNTSHPDLEGHTGVEMILANNAMALMRVLENAAAGVPV